MGKRLNISRQAYLQLENSETTLKISLQNLIKMAKALESDFYYVILPKRRLLFSELIWEKIKFKAFERYDKIRGRIKTKSSDSYEARILKTIAQQLEHNSEFRKKQNWIRNS
jgi:transcriptional regulator with XRE-family HTH domain